MSELFISVAGHRCTTAKLYVPCVGPWLVDLQVDDSVDLSGKVTVELGSLKLVGTVAPAFTDRFVLSTTVRVVAGAGAWGTIVKPKAYHNDAGVKASTVAQDIAREVGEQLGSFVPAADKLGVDYVRRSTELAVTAARVLEDALGGAGWWVDYAGITQCSPRPQAPPPKFELLSFDATTRTAVLGADDPAAVVIGSVLTDDRLSGPLTVRELEVDVSEGALRVKAWCGGEDGKASRLQAAIKSLVRRATDDQLLGLYRYRVFSMAGERVNLQAVRKGAGLPDLLPVTMRPGAPGYWAQLTKGSEVLVQFIEGDPALPIITNFPGKKEPGFVPDKIAIGDDDDTAPPAARQGDTVRVLLPPAVFTGTVNGLPATGVVTWSVPSTLGTIETGSGKVVIG